jgi:hypothetical protein
MSLILKIVLSFNHIGKNRSMFVKKKYSFNFLFFRVIEGLFRVENDFIEVQIVFFKCSQVKISEKYVFGVQKIRSYFFQIIW